MLTRSNMKLDVAFKIDNRWEQGDDCTWKLSNGWAVKSHAHMDSCNYFVNMHAPEGVESGDHFGHSFLVRAPVAPFFISFLVACARKLMEDAQGPRWLMGRLLLAVAIVTDQKAIDLGCGPMQHQSPVDEASVKRLAEIGVDRMVDSILDEHRKKQADADRRT